MMKVRLRNAVDRIWFGGALLALAGASAQGDIRLTAELHTTRTGGPTQVPLTVQPADDETKTITGYFKGDRVRVETDGGDTVVYDLAARRVYVLNSADKTYSILTIAEFIARHQNVASRRLAADLMAPELKADVKADLKKDAVVEPKTFAGKQARLYDLTENVSLRLDEPEVDPGRGSGGGFPGGGGRGGGRRGGGGGGRFPGGGEGGGGRTGARPTPSVGSARIEGEVWLTEDTALKLKSKHMTLPLFAAAIPSEPALFALSDKIAKSGGFPISSKITMNWHSGRPGSDTAESATVIMDVKAISEETLEDSLFKVPSDYAKSAAH